MVRMTRMLRSLLMAFAILAGVVAPSQAAGTLPVVLQQQFSFTGCTTTGQACGAPLNGGLLYFFQAGTVATPQDSFADIALSLKNPWPLQLDANGRVPPFYLADGTIHIRLTDASGLVQFDYASMMVIGPSSGGGGGGGTVDPTTILSTGDIKFRVTSEQLTGFVKLNGLTIGSAISGASGRANNDTQNLFVYLWTNCPNTRCAVPGGRGGSGLADFSANKQLTVPDWRDRLPVGLDCMGNTCAGGLLASNVTSAGDGVDTPGATGGAANPLIGQTNLPNVNFPVTDPGHYHFENTGSAGGGGVLVFGASTGVVGPAGAGANTGQSTDTRTTGISVGSGGSATPFSVMSPFSLVTWHMKL